MIIMLVFALLFAPVCATVAGFAVWALHRDETLDDGELLRNFIVMGTMCAIALYATSRTHTVRVHLDPYYRVQTEIEAYPVYDALSRFSPSEARSLRDSLEQEMLQGETLASAALKARPWLTKVTNHRTGFVDQATRLRWGRFVVDSLKELQGRDPALCYQAISGQPLELQILQGFSPENAGEFEQVVIAVHESADGGMRHERRPHDKPADFNEAAREFHVIKDSLEQRFGKSIAAQISSRKFPEVPTESPREICAARIAQLEAMMQRPKHLASMLVDSALR